MEGIYGCMERIETGIIELQKSKQSNNSSAIDNNANETLILELKELINENNKQGFEYTEAKIKKFASAVIEDLNIINNNVKEAKSAIVNARTSTEVLNSLKEIKTNQEQKSDEVKTLVQKLKETIEDGVHNFTFELLEECPRDQLNEKERLWIEIYQTDSLGYNSTKGNK